MMKILLVFLLVGLVAAENDESDTYESCEVGWTYSRVANGIQGKGFCYKGFFQKSQRRVRTFAAFKCRRMSAEIADADSDDEKDFIARMPGKANYKENEHLWLGMGWRRLDNKCDVVKTKHNGAKTLLSCHAKLGFVCKKAPTMSTKRPVVNPRIMMPWQQKKFAKELMGAKTCIPSEDKALYGHQVCLKNWRDLYKVARGPDEYLEAFKAQCPAFCDPPNFDGTCLWNIACTRCLNLLKICEAIPAYCQHYIAEQKDKSDAARCPQFKFCKVTSADMSFVRSNCEDFYVGMKEDVDSGVQGALKAGKARSVCKKVCEKVEEGCGYKHACKKCTLLIDLLTSPRGKPEFDAVYPQIMAKPEGKRCDVYQGKSMPTWWVTGNWL